MKITEKTGNVINDLELILRSHIGKNLDISKLYRCRGTKESEIRFMKYKGVFAPFYVGDALIEMLDYLEKRYDIDFDNMPIKDYDFVNRDNT